MVIPYLISVSPKTPIFSIYPTRQTQNMICQCSDFLVFQCELIFGNKIFGELGLKHCFY
jgi:hypothetical protein